MFSNITSTSISRIATPQPTIHVVSCVYNMETMVYTFLGEYSLSFYLGQPMIRMCKKVSQDSSALKIWHIFRPTARFFLISFSYCYSLSWSNGCLPKTCNSSEKSVSCADRLMYRDETFQNWFGQDTSWWFSASFIRCW